MKRSVFRELIKTIFSLAEAQRTQSCLWLFGSNAGYSCRRMERSGMRGGLLKLFFTAEENILSIFWLLSPQVTLSAMYSQVFAFLNKKPLRPLRLCEKQGVKHTIRD